MMDHGGGNSDHTSSDLNMSKDIFAQQRDKSDTEFEKKGSVDDDDNIIGGLGGSISSGKNIGGGGHDETVMMG